MDPITMATLTTALVTLGTAALEGAGGKVGEAAAAKAIAYWGKAKGLLGFKSDPAPGELAPAIAKAVEANPAAKPEMLRLVNEYQTVTGQSLVGSVHVNKGVVNVVGQNTGTMSQTLNFNGD